MDLTHLNKDQEEAVLYNEGPLAVIASAGSGKSRVLTTKIQYLVTEKDIRPNRIWAFTFTNKAADEMRERLEGMIGDKAARIQLGTIHSTAYKVLKMAKQSLNPNHKMPKIMVNTGPVLMHLYTFLKKGNYRFQDAKEMLSEISLMKMELITTKNFKEHCDYISTKSHVADMNQTMHEVYIAYEKFLKDKRYMDFGDMLVDCYRCLVDPKYAEFTARIQKRAEYILVDEVQDTNSVSFKIAQILSKGHNRMSIYGDLRQCIYSFQGADDSLTRTWLKDVNAKIVDLPINYRSTSTIVENANKLISFQSDVIGVPATTPNEVGEAITFRTSETLEDEADWVTELIQKRVSKGDSYKDITILYRVHSQAEQLINSFMVHNIPHIQFVKTNFFLRKEVKDIITYLRIAKDYDSMELKDIKTVVHKPSRYISNLALSAVSDYCEDQDCGIREALNDSYELDLNSMQIRNLSNMHDQFKKLAQMYKSGSDIESIITYICDEIGYEQYAIDEKLEREPDADVTMDFDALKSTARSFDTVDNFLADVDKRIKDSKKKVDEKADAIKLMSIHASKGKEFKTVIVVGMCNRLYPLNKAVSAGTESEERRIVYVALTRPEKKLYLSAIWGNMGRFNVEPSIYLNQMNITYSGDNSYDGYNS